MPVRHTTAGRAASLAAAIALVACATRAPVQARPPSSHAASPAAAQPSIARPPPPAVPPPPVTFTELPALAFRPGPALRLKAIAKQSRIIALSPDATSWVLDAGDVALLVTPQNPRGYRFDATISSALFSADGSRVLIWSYFGGFGVLDVATGAVRAQRDTSTCAARFAGADRVVYHTASKEGDGQLFQLSLASGRSVALGDKRSAETCHASLDGTRWLVESYDKRWFVDGATGGARALPMESAPGGVAGTLSTAGDRLCTGDDAGFRCVRYPDERVENVWQRPSSDTYSVYDPTGKRALFMWADGADDVRDAYALVDFEARQVRALRGVSWPSGSTFALGHGGALLTIGGARGLSVYDLDRGVKRFAAHAPLYGNFVFPYAPRAIVAGTDEPMDLFLIDAT